MSDFDPIEIEIAINSPELILQSEQIEKSLGEVDAAVEKTEKTFHSYLAAKLKAQGVDVKSLQLKEQEIQKIQKYTGSISQLKLQMDKTTDPTQLDVYKFKVDELQKKINTLLTNKANATVIPDIDKQATSVGRTKRQWDGLGNSINQVTRELPSFAFSAQTGFLAISNNIPILADEILRLRLKNQELVASGQKGIPVWKQVLKSFASWQTLLSIGVSLFVVYGKEIGGFIGDLFKGEKALDSFKKRTESLNKAFKEGGYTKAIQDVLELKAAFKSAEKGFLDKEVVLKQYNKTLGKVLGTTNDINVAEKTLRDKSAAYIKAMLLKTAATIQAADAAKKLVENQNKIFQIDVDIDANKKKFEKIKSQPTTKVVAGQLVSNSTKDASIVEELQLKSQKSKLEKANEVLKNDSVKIITKFNKEIKDIADNFKLNLDGDTPDATVVNSRKNLLQKLADLDQEYTRKSYTKDQEEIQALKDKFSKIRKLVTEFNADPKNKAQTISLTGLNTLETNATDALVYRQETKTIGKQLDQEKNLYAAYEAFKTKTSEAEAQKKYGKLIGAFKNYGELLEAEYSKLQEQFSEKPKDQVTGAEQERLIDLQERLDTYRKDQNKTAEQQFIDAYNSTITHNEQLLFIEQDFAARELELNKIKDENLRKQKKTELAYQKKIAIDNANSEAYERTQIFEQLSADLLGITKRDLANRIASLEEYLQISKDKLTTEQLEYVRHELEKAKAIQSTTNLGIRENVLLQKKAALVKKISDLRSKGIINVADELDALAEINSELETMFVSKLGKLSNIASEFSAIFSNAATDLKDVDEGLADTLETMSDLGNVAADALSSFASFASGNILGGITGAISAIGGIFSMGAKVRESERKAREEIKKWHQEIFDSQLAYNAELRKRILDEVKINDLYQSRVTNIKEQIAANKQNAAEVLKDQQAIFKRLLDMQVTTNKRTYTTGAWFWKRTHVEETKKSIKDLLGYTGELSDDIFDKLQKLNRDTPLTGDAKTAYEELKKLRDEYGSIDEAIRNLEIQLKDTVTGTTAQSIADSIKQGIESGKKTFADFADDIEGFLRQAILSGMSAKILEPQMQELQDLLYNFLGDDILTADEKKQFQEMYLRIAKEASDYIDLINQTGIGIGTEVNTANSLKGAVKGITAEQADLFAGQFGGFRLAQLTTNFILNREFKSQFEVLSKSVSIQLDIEKNTRRTAENTDKLGSIDTSLKDIKESIKPDNTSKANGF